MSATIRGIKMNGKIFLICGKVCSGKSTLAALLRASENAVVLSCDEVVFSLFGEDFGERHEEVTNRVKKYLCKKAAEIAHIGGNVILDWGFWSRTERQHMRRFFEIGEIRTVLYYVDVTDEEWHRNIKCRNDSVLNGNIAEYYVDAALAEKSAAQFEIPDENERAIFHKNY